MCVPCVHFRFAARDCCPRTANGTDGGSSPRGWTVGSRGDSKINKFKKIFQMAKNWPPWRAVCRLRWWKESRSKFIRYIKWDLISGITKIAEFLARRTLHWWGQFSRMWAKWEKRAEKEMRKAEGKLMTEDGFCLCFGMNHLRGTALMSKLKQYFNTRFLKLCLS